MARDQRHRPPFMGGDWGKAAFEQHARHREPPHMHVPDDPAVLDELMRAANSGAAGYIVYPDRIEVVTVDQMYQQALPVIDLIEVRSATGSVWMTREDAIAAGVM